MSNGTKAKIDWIEYARGLALFLVVFAHSQIPWKVFEVISYLIVIFPFLSGYLHNAKSLKDLVKKRLPLLASYYYIGAINYLVWVSLVSGNFRKADNLTYLKNFVLVQTDKFDQIPLGIVPLWYLVFLFFAEILYYVSRKTKLAIPVIIIGILSRFYFPGSLPFKIDVALAGLYMFEIGRLFKEKNIEIKKYTALLAMMSWLAISFLNGGTNWNVDDYGKNPLLSLLGEVASLLVIVWIAQSVDRIGALKKLLGKFFKNFSDNAIFVLGYHILLGGIVIALLLALGFNVTEENLRNYWYITFLIMVSTVYVVMNILPKKVKVFLTQPLAIKDLFEERKSNR